MSSTLPVQPALMINLLNTSVKSMSIQAAVMYIPLLSCANYNTHKPVNFCFVLTGFLLDTLLETHCFSYSVKLSCHRAFIANI